MAATCSAIEASATVRDSRRGPAEAGEPSFEVEETIAVPAIKQVSRTCVDLARRQLPRIREAPDRSPSLRRPVERVAVNESVSCIVEQLRATVQAYASARGTSHERIPSQGAMRRRKRDGGLGLGEIRPQEPCDRSIVPRQLGQSTPCVGRQTAPDVGGRAHLRRARIAVATFQRNAIGEPVEKSCPELL